ncbi:MAG: sulfate adenylyltransferase [Thermoplasmata archaeon]|nr:sulfate adenylyltransferase [Thermoplasmata archaeon]
MDTPRPHGGRLIDRLLSENERKRIFSGETEFHQLVRKEETLIDAANIAAGIFSPLEGFLRQDELASILNERRLPDDTPWTIPVLLDISENESANIMEGDECLVTDPQNNITALLRIEEKYRFNKKEIAEKVFGTNDPQHPGVARTLNLEDVFLGGDIDLVKEEESTYDRFKLSPAETRILFREKGWRTIVGFQTRNPPHLGHEWIQRTALTFADGVFINPLIGKKKKGDFKDELILESYDRLIKDFFLRERAVLSILRTDMKYAGPREAIHHAIMRKNFGCTHFIIGRDHAGVGSFYDPYAAQDMFDEFPDLGIVPMFFSSFFHCNKCGGIANEKTCPHGEEHHIKFSGTAIRESIEKGDCPQKELMREEIAEILLADKNPFVE